ncbi:MAG: O-antigen ligase family protein [Bacteroidales bacterium]|nr:O-antigen ligase family protein [Bacteroidales bacterium]
MFDNRNIAIGSFVLLFAFMQVLWPVPSPLPTNQLFMILAMLLIFIKSNGDETQYSWQCMLFLGAIVLSIVSNQIPAFFKPWQRLMQFAFLFIAASPLISGVDVNRLRRHMFLGVVWACSVVAVWSFVAFLTGQGQYLSGIIQGYMGVTAHPNFLGMFVMVAMVWFSSLYFRSTESWERVTWGGCWVACLIVILLSASRSSTACGLLGTLAVVFFRFRKNGGKMFTAVVVLVLAFIISLPYLMPYMETMMQKGVSSDSEQTDALVAATRGAIWELRFMELNESPLVGVGAFSCDINLPNADVFYTEATGSIEQGSSYLGLLSQTGWIGFICFLLILVPVVVKTFRFAMNENTPYAQLLAAMMLPILVHMAVEGYAITAGAVQCVILWFVIGAGYQCDKVADYPVLWENEDPITPEDYVIYKESELEE